jgi:Holliday junction resolvase RusA-like endonuclease
VTACVNCAYDPEAVVTVSWKFTLPKQLGSLNDHVINAGRSRWQYKREREEWRMLLTNARRLHEVTRPIGKRIVVLTRLYSGRERERDHDNLVGAAKPVLDAMVKAGLLVDDAPAFLVCTYRQEKAVTSGVRVEISEVRP